MIHLQALNRNAGTCFGMSKENTQVKETRGRNTEDQSRGGLLRSSDEPLFYLQKTYMVDQLIIYQLCIFRMNPNYTWLGRKMLLN